MPTRRSQTTLPLTEIPARQELRCIFSRKKKDVFLLKWFLSLLRLTVWSLLIRIFFLYIGL